MARTAQWRTKGHLIDAVLLLDESGSVLEVIPATPLVLSRFLTDSAGLETATNGAALNEDKAAADERDPEAWGQLVLARGSSGEVLEVEPELFWHGIYSWFRSRGVDYDTPGAQLWPPMHGVPDVPLSSLMDD
jgi:hypothetical protein